MAFGIRIFRADTVGSTWIDGVSGVDATAECREVPQPLVISSNFANLLGGREALDGGDSAAPMPDEENENGIHLRATLDATT